MGYLASLEDCLSLAFECLAVQKRPVQSAACILFSTIVKKYIGEDNIQLEQYMAADDFVHFCEKFAQSAIKIGDICRLHLPSVTSSSTVSLDVLCMCFLISHLNKLQHQEPKNEILVILKQFFVAGLSSPADKMRRLSARCLVKMVHESEVSEFLESIHRGLDIASKNALDGFGRLKNAFVASFPYTKIQTMNGILANTGNDLPEMIHGPNLS